MIIEIDSFLPLVTIIGAASAPTIAAIWAERQRSKDARHAASALVEATSVTAEKVSEVKSTLLATSTMANDKLDMIHVLVNNQLTEAVNRLGAATDEINELKLMIIARQHGMEQKGETK